MMAAADETGAAIDGRHLDRVVTGAVLVGIGGVLLQTVGPLGTVAGLGPTAVALLAAREGSRLVRHLGGWALAGALAGAPSFVIAGHPRAPIGWAFLVFVAALTAWSLGRDWTPRAIRALVLACGIRGAMSVCCALTYTELQVLAAPVLMLDIACGMCALALAQVASFAGQEAVVFVATLAQGGLLLLQIAVLAALLQPSEPQRTVIHPEESP